ncbi:hypothetical protein SLA2020_346150 [Shorea laevis]
MKLGRPYLERHWVLLTSYIVHYDEDTLNKNIVLVQQWREKVFHVRFVDGQPVLVVPHIALFQLLLKRLRERSDEALD